MPRLTIVLKLDGISGESTIARHVDEIDVLSYEQGLNTPVIVEGGGGGGTAGRTSFSPLRFRKWIDRASVPLALACAAGTRVRNAVFTFLRRESGIEFYTVTLDDVLVTGVNVLAGTRPQYPLSFTELDEGADASAMLEEVSLHFGRIQWRYQRFTGDRPDGPPIVGGWDVAGNQRL